MVQVCLAIGSLWGQLLFSKLLRQNFVCNNIKTLKISSTSKSAENCRRNLPLIATGDRVEWVRMAAALYRLLPGCQDDEDNNGNNNEDNIQILVLLQFPFAIRPVQFFIWYLLISETLGVQNRWTLSTWCWLYSDNHALHKVILVSGKL